MSEFKNGISTYRETLLGIQEKMQASYDKAVIALSGGALGLSFTFLKEVANREALIATHWLLASWVLWAMSVSCILFSFLSSATAMQKAIKQTDEKTIYIEAAGGLFDRITKLLNVAAGLMFIVGIICIVVFVWRNTP